MYILLKETYNVGKPHHGPEPFAQIIAPPFLNGLWKVSPVLSCRSKNIFLSDAG